MTELSSLDDREVAAAGLALGLLEDAERAAALRLMLEDRAFAARVIAWQAVGDRWLEEVDPVEAPAAALAAIEARLDRHTAALTAPASSVESVAAGRRRTWALTATAASLVLTIGLAFALLSGNRDADAADPRATVAGRSSANIAQIKDADGAPLVSALYNPAAGTLSLRIADLQGPDVGPELWITPQDGAPQSLGLLAGNRVVVRPPPQLRPLLQDGATIAITIEPRAGAPHKAPTGAILGTGVLQEVPGTRS